MLDKRTARRPGNPALFPACPSATGGAQGPYRAARATGGAQAKDARDVPFSLGLGAPTLPPETARYRSVGVPQNAGSERYRAHARRADSTAPALTCNVLSRRRPSAPVRLLGLEVDVGWQGGDGGADQEAQVGVFPVVG